MKKTPKMILLSLALALMLPFFTLNAQTDIFKKGDLVFSAGVGIGNAHGNYWSAYSKTTVPPIFITGDYCLREDLGPGNLGVGGIMAFSAYKDDYAGWGYKYNTFTIGVRGTYHFTDLVPKMDLYGGVSLGADIVNEKGYGDYAGLEYTVNGSSALVEIFAGARYYFSDNVGVMSELGYGVAWIKLGIAFKL
jgi:hypothetical protein